MCRGVVAGCAAARGGARGIRETIMEFLIVLFFVFLAGFLFTSRKKRRALRAKLFKWSRITLVGRPPRLLIGTARVIDGDSIVVNRMELRLEGIDAPESQQTSVDSHGRPFPQGRQATRYLRTLIGSNPVRCQTHGFDRYGRILVTVFASDGKNINAEMVRAGQAIAYMRYSHRYIKEEREAKRYRRGMHSGTWITPHAWRNGYRVAARDVAERGGG